MATANQIEAARATANTGQARWLARQLATFTFVAAGTYKAQITLPAGSHLVSVPGETPTAISGSPTSANFRCGTTDTGQEVVADTDLKAQGHFTNTIVAGFNKIAFAAAADTVLFLQVVVAGGTAPAGTIYAPVDYYPPILT